MDNYPSNQVFLSYNEADLDLVEMLSIRLQNEARLIFWFAPWHSIPGQPTQDQMEAALESSQACMVLIHDTEEIDGWQNEQMRAAIQLRVEDDSDYRVIPVLLSGVQALSVRKLPRFLRRYQPVIFGDMDDERAFKALIAGILGIRPIEVDGFVETAKNNLQIASSGNFKQGHALIIGIANYGDNDIRDLPEVVRNDAQDLRSLLTDLGRCGYVSEQVSVLLDDAATGDGIRAALTGLATHTGADDTVVIFFSGHGAHNPADESEQYLLPYDANPAQLPKTSIAGSEMTALLRSIKAGRLLVIFDCCHSGGIGEPKGKSGQIKNSFSESYYAALAQGRGRVVMASSRPNEASWVLPGMENSLFTYHLLEALRGKAYTLGDGYIRVFDLFRHISEQVRSQANKMQIQQHPIFKASAMEEDFPVALL